MRLILCQTASAGGHHPNDFSNKSTPPPSNPTTVHPLSTLPAFVSGRALITEFPGNCPNRLSCVAMCAVGWFGHKSGLLHEMSIGCSCLVSVLTGKRESPFVKLSSGTNHSSIFVLFVCKLTALLSALVNCQTQGF